MGVTRNAAGAPAMAPARNIEERLLYPVSSANQVYKEM